MTAPVLEGQLDLLEALQNLQLAQTRENLPPPPYMPGEHYADVPADLVCPDCGHQAPNVIVYQINHLQMPPRGDLHLRATCTTTGQHQEGPTMKILERLKEHLPVTRKQFPKRRPRSSHSSAAHTLWFQQDGMWKKVVNAHVIRQEDGWTIIAYPDSGEVASIFYFEETQ